MNTKTRLEKLAQDINEMQFTDRAFEENFFKQLVNRLRIDLPGYYVVTGSIRDSSIRAESNGSLIKLKTTFSTTLIKITGSVELLDEEGAVAKVGQNIRRSLSKMVDIKELSKSLAQQIMTIIERLE